MKTRMCVIGVIQNGNGEYLITKKPDDWGVYPGLWGMPGGGVDEGEMIEQALCREMKEETGLEIDQIMPWYFDDDKVVKRFKDGTEEKQYLIFLYFKAVGIGTVVLNTEHVEYVWVSREDVDKYALSEKTKKVFERLNNEN